jgi:N-acetylated-alpha-linked acidic dipeptidase
MNTRVAAAGTVFLLAMTAGGDDSPILGFSATAAKTQQEWETKFRAIPDPANLRAYMQFMTARPHHLGSPYGKEVAEWAVTRMKEWGLDAKIEAYDALFPTPRERVLEMVAPMKFTAKLEEPPVAGDPTSAQKAEQLPTYNAYSIDGDVTGQLVYVNYGREADYEELARMGVDVKGAIVIARYGANFRGTKPKIAAEHGAIGCIIYSDPKDDGFFYGADYPEGPNRPKDGVQRGSVMDLMRYAGDPLTPGVASTAAAKRLKREEATTITKIPVLPISYADAQPLLAAMTGPMAPEAWRGSLPIPYRAGPGPARVHLKLTFNWDVKPVYDVVARIPGTSDPDTWIVRGNHHDAWVNGAGDPVSGAVALLEEARALGSLLKQGWRPKRTIIYCLWDGEEQGLIGSTEWAEDHAAELQQKAAVYINTDGNGRGYLFASGSHTLEKFVNGVAKDITDPESKLSVWKRQQFSRIATSNGTDRQEARSRADLRIGALGTGSDYTAFLDHLGIASLNISYGGEDDDGGTYHSIYDDFTWYTKFVDTDFAYGKALAQTVGTAVMRLAGAELLPLEFGNFTNTLRRYIDDVQKLAKDSRDQIIEQNRQIDEGLFAAVDDPKQKRFAPPRQQVPPYLNFAPLENGFASLQKAAGDYTQAVAKANGDGGSALAKAELREANRRLIAIERSLTLKDGLPGREWYQHQIYAPGFYTGYGVKTLPGVRESIEQKDWKLADEQIGRLGKVLEVTGESIASASAELARAVQ